MATHIRCSLAGACVCSMRCHGGTHAFLQGTWCRERRLDVIATSKHFFHIFRWSENVFLRATVWKARKKRKGFDKK